MKATVPQKINKQDRELQVLLGLVDLYLKTGKPVGSNTLKEAGFTDFSAATIRNYFSHLEEEGYLLQQHSSGGRVPTAKAYRFYARENLESGKSPIYVEKLLHTLEKTETREIALLLQNAAESLSLVTHTAVFLSAPRFDNDSITSLRLFPLDHQRCLGVIITDFGVIRTETFPLEHKITAFTAKRIEEYFHWRLTGLDKPDHLEPKEEELACKLYNELLLRYIVGYSTFLDAELYRTGFTQLLHYPSFQDPIALSTSLTLFENTHNLRLLVKECTKSNHLKFWIGDDLTTYLPTAPYCSVIVAPYYVNQSVAGAIGLLGPIHLPYRNIFAILNDFSRSISTAITNNLYKFKITARQPHNVKLTESLLQQNQRLLLTMQERNLGDSINE